MIREYVYEFIGIAEGIRNLDEPHLPPHSLVSVNAPPIPSPQTPCESETCAGLSDEVYDRAFAAYIEEEEEAEDSNRANAGSSGDTVSVN